MIIVELYLIVTCFLSHISEDGDRLKLFLTAERDTRSKSLLLSGFLIKVFVSLEIAGATKFKIIRDPSCSF